MIVGTGSLETGAKEVADFIQRMGGSATADQVEEFEDPLERAAEAEAQKLHEASDKAGKAREIEKTNSRESVRLYREAISAYVRIAEKSRNPWIWRDVPYLYNRLTQVLERLHEYGEALAAATEFECLPCADQGTKSDREAIAKRKQRLLQKTGSIV